jgi:predicted amidohydrolase YtcJ
MTNFLAGTHFRNCCWRCDRDQPSWPQGVSPVVLNAKAISTIGVASDDDLPPSGKLEMDAEGKPTGVVRGNVPTLGGIHGRIPAPTMEQQIEGTLAYFRRLNSLGLTGVNDTAGGGIRPEHCQPIFRVWRDCALTLRVAFHINSQKRGGEVEDLKETLSLLPQGFGDDMLRFNGIGEVVIWSMHDGSTTGPGFQGPPEGKEALRELAGWAADRGLVIHMHASSNGAAEQILDIFEEVHEETPIDDLRWVIAHIEDATLETMQRMKALGIGFSVQNRLYRT